MDHQQDSKQPSKDRNDQVQKKDKPFKTWAVFSGMGLQMGLTIYLGNILGVWLDKKFQTLFLEETMTLIAVFSAMFMIINRVNKLNK
nr:AtpZ/AtpI family protein [uncultured Psychroserpens sp.]